ncbi:MAG: helicase-related protein [Candidatus Bathyarchaeia archaeon]|nr:DEAD/DEAH box helicase [Candidatus Bathyarchaeota archaeon]
MLAEKRYVWHNLLKEKAVEDRLYQNRILEKARQYNTLVVLPTALGKTVIALLLAIEKAEEGKIFFLAPTRPLVQQHHQTFLDKTWFDENELVLVTGRYPPNHRSALYSKAKVVFATPQCVWNDLKSGLLRLDDVSLIVFDEAHRARGNYAYVGIATYYFRQCRKPLVLGLTASPGGSEEKIAEVCRNLGITAIEHRTDEDKDVKPYIQPIEVEWRRVKPPEQYLAVRDKLRQMLVERVKGLQALGVLTDKQPAFITRRDLIEFNDELQRRLGGGEGGYLYQLKVEATAALSIAHMIELIESQGPETLEAFIEKSLKRMAMEGSRGHKSILNDPLFIEARKSLRSCTATENPKVKELVKVLEAQLQAKPDSRLIVFTQYRDTVNALIKALNNNSRLRVERFVGQGEREGDPGMSQEQQREVLEKLRSGETNVLVATSIAEEGLDIPEVDHVVFYEPVPSEIRYIQRRGRTGRRVAGKVTILIAEDTVDEAFYWSSISRARKMKRIISQLNRKLPELLKEKATPTITLMDYQPQTRQAPINTQTLQAQAEVAMPKKELWRPKTIQTKGLSQAMKWLMENLPNQTIPIEEVVKRAYEEEGLEKAAVETAIWRLTQQGQIYQPQPGKIRKL